MSGKPAAVIGASTGMFGAVWAQAETRKVLSALGARVVESELPVGHAADLVSDSRLALPPELDARLEEILAELIAAAELAAPYAQAAA
jgi:chromate reductase